MMMAYLVGSGAPCARCVHYQGTLANGPDSPPRFVCAAFPAGIPREILDGSNDHTQPINGDHGILFEAKP